MAAYCRVYDSHHLQADCPVPGSAPGPYTWQSGMGYLYLFYVSARNDSRQSGMLTWFLVRWRRRWSRLCWRRQSIVGSTPSCCARLLWWGEWCNWVLRPTDQTLTAPTAYTAGYRYTHTCKNSWTHTHTRPFNGPLSGTTRVSQYQKGKTNLDFTEARDSEWQWHRLGHMQIYTSLQMNNHASTPPLSFLQAGCPSCHPTNSAKAMKASVLKVCKNSWT